MTVDLLNLKPIGTFNIEILYVLIFQSSIKGEFYEKWQGGDMYILILESYFIKDDVQRT